MAHPVIIATSTMVATAVLDFSPFLCLPPMNLGLTSQATRAARAATASTKLFPFDQYVPSLQPQFADTSVLAVSVSR